MAILMREACPALRGDGPRERGASVREASLIRCERDDLGPGDPLILLGRTYRVAEVEHGGYLHLRPVAASS